LAAAAAQANVPMVMSGSSLIRLEDVAAASSSTWFQAYLPGDEKAIVALIERVARAGATHPRWLFGTFLRTLVRHGMPHFENNFAARGAPILSPSVLREYSDRGHLHWAHWRMVRRIWGGRLIIKGILDKADAQRARDEGADGIVVSNHGGRQLDGAVAALRVLPAIVAACPDVPIMLDGGVRRGTDVLKALALGAKFVFAGRPFAYAAAIGG